MRFSATVLLFTLAATTPLGAQVDRDFSGVWRLNSAQSEIRNLPAPVAPVLRVEQSPTTLTAFSSDREDGPSDALSYPLDGRSIRNQVGGSVYNAAAKWEGSALLVNTLVSGSESYSINDRWVRSRDGRRLTIERSIVRRSGESESTLVYDNSAFPPPVPSSSPAPAPGRQPVLISRSTNVHQGSLQEGTLRGATRGSDAPLPIDYLVPAGTRLLLRLTNAVSTKRSTPGDRVYLQTAAPIFVEGRLVIPVGSYVTGTITEAQRAGRVKGKSSLDLRFESVTLPNGTARDVHSRAGAVDAKGNLDRSEGRIEGDSNRGGDARTVATTTAAGTGIGAMAGAAAGHLGMGAGIGAAAGAAAGLASVFGSRGPDVVLPAGTTMELLLDRDLSFSEEELRRIQ